MSEPPFRRDAGRRVELSALNRAEAVVEEALAEGFALEPDLTVSEWADERRVLSRRSSAEHGPWRTSRNPPMRDVMDALSANPPARLNIPTSSPRRIVLIKPTQAGGSECGNNMIGYVIDHAPGPALMVVPTLPLARKISRQRIGPMLEESPSLRAKTKLTTKEAGNTMLEKEGAGWSLTLVGCKAAAGLKAAPIRYLLGDEVDEWPGDVEGQGDPVMLAERRLDTYGRRAIAYYVSTPTIRGASRIETLFLSSDQRRYFVPCPACSHMDHMRWENLVWEEGKPSTARLRCVDCGELIEEYSKPWMLDRGEWRATAPPGKWDQHTVGFHLNSLYTPLGWGPSWEQMGIEFEEAKQDPSKLKTFVNTRLAETWEERGEGADPDALLARAERYSIDGGVPNGVGYLVAAVDVQGDRLEAVVKGYGVSDESWLIAHHVFVGNPERDEVWYELDEWLLQPFPHESGQLVSIGLAVVDSNYLADKVYKFVRPRQQRSVCPVFAVRGGNERKKALLATSSVHKAHRVRIYTLCTDTGKDIVSKRLQIGKPPTGRGPGYMHLPEWVTKSYVEQLTAEKKLPKSTRGKATVYEWTKIRPRNEALDLEVYCLAALDVRGPALKQELAERAARWAKASDAASKAPPERALPSPAPTQRPNLRSGGRGWIGRHRPGR